MAVLLEAGTLFARDFRVVRPLAEGGMGAVYVVEQVSTAKPRALKVMHPQFVTDAKSRARFAQEARVGARIESDHVVEVVGAGVDEVSGAPWLAMELLQGQDLAEAVHQRGPLPPQEVLEIFKQLCHALSAAHRVGLVHRDLKPENVFLAAARREGVPFTVKILDFGIAKLVQEAATSQTQAMGSPLWMAPEQTEQGGSVRPASDVWALGLIAFHLLVKRYYWKSANDPGVTLMTLLREVVMEPIEPASSRAARYGLQGALPPGFDAWFSRCVVRDIDARFRDAAEALSALLPVLDRAAPQGVSASPSFPQVAPTTAWSATAVAPPPFSQPGAPAPRPQGALAALLGGVALVVVAGLAVAAVSLSKDRGGATASPPLAQAPVAPPSTPTAPPPATPPATGAPNAAVIATLTPPPAPPPEVVTEVVLRSHVEFLPVERTGGTGDLNPEVIASLVRRHLVGIQSCFERSLINDPTLAGRLDVATTIDTAGRATATPRGMEATPAIGACVALRIRSLVAPRSPNGSSDFNLAFVFSSRSSASTGSEIPLPPPRRPAARPVRVRRPGEIVDPWGN